MGVSTKVAVVFTGRGVLLGPATGCSVAGLGFGNSGVESKEGVGILGKVDVEIGLGVE